LPEALSRSDVGFAIERGSLSGSRDGGANRVVHVALLY
jgi:hypothetical protein